MNRYAVNDIYATIQGEGALAGVPMILLRLQGCDVGCPFCDTKETWERGSLDTKKLSLVEALGQNPNWVELEAKAIADEVCKMAAGETWVLLTGGEPADQDLGLLIEALHDKSFRVAIETSGTAAGHLSVHPRKQADWVCVSPKVDMPGGRTVDPHVARLADEVKFVIGKQADIENVKARISEWSVKTAAVALQPMSMLPKATELCMEAVREHGWRLSIQTHKVLSIR